MKKTAALVLAVLLLAGLSGCSGVSQAEYDALAAERDALADERYALTDKLAALQQDYDAAEAALERADSDALRCAREIFEPLDDGIQCAEFAHSSSKLLYITFFVSLDSLTDDSGGLRKLSETIGQKIALAVYTEESFDYDYVWFIAVAKTGPLTTLVINCSDLSISQHNWV